MGGGMDGFKYERRGLRRQRELERRQVERQHVATRQRLERWQPVRLPKLQDFSRSLRRGSFCNQPLSPAADHTSEFVHLF